MCFRAVAVFLFTLLLCGCAGSASPATEPAKPDVKVVIAVRDGNGWSKRNPIQVVVENTSGNPQGHFEEWNSWGYYNLTLIWTDGKGNKGVVEKVPINWTMNFPSMTVLQPGDVLVRQISFDQKEWKGWPEDLSDLTIQAVYQSKIGDADSSTLRMQNVAPWTGTVKSKAHALTI